MPMVKSKAQVRFYRGVVAGHIEKPGLSIDEAAERLRGVEVAKLPKRKRRKLL